MKKILCLFFAITASLSAQDALTGSLRYADGSLGRVSFVDMAIRGKVGMKMERAINTPPYREQIIITQRDIDYALKEISLDGVVTKDDDGNVIIIISATHRRIINPAGEITEVFENTQEFSAFFFQYTSKYSNVIKAINTNGEKKSFIALPLNNNAFNRMYMRVIPYEEICIIESINYPIKGYAYRETRATDTFIKNNPNAAYILNKSDSNLFMPSGNINLSPVENGYFSFIQEAQKTNFNNKIDVYEEQLKIIHSKKDITEITAEEMEKLFDGSLLSAEIIAQREDAISTAAYDKLK